MVESNPAVVTGEQFVTNQAWVQALVEKNVFEGDPDNWRITTSNYKQVLHAIRVNVQQFEHALKQAIVRNDD